ncbi:MAG: glycosyltransferase family 4 protein [Rhodothalassiaceae bacterium]
MTGSRQPMSAGPERGRRVAILYHYMYPDDVVSAQHLSGLAEDLAAQGWQVEALPCNRGCRDDQRLYARREQHQGVRYNRIWRPRWPQNRALGRLANAIWMMTAWSLLALRGPDRRPDIVIIGTDPVFALLVAVPLKLLAPRMTLAHWCFDLHPEAAMAAGQVRENGVATRLVRWAMRRAYQRCDLIADLGSCMRQRLRRHDHSAREVELTPWALVEPTAPVAMDPVVRTQTFGAARLALLYSGNFGEAHSYEELLGLARRLRHEEAVRFCFAVRGNRAEALKQAVGPEDRNIRFAGFVPLAELETRLGSADIHLMSLKPDWAGIAVPSKFFGSLASGRPIIFAGDRHSAVARWIADHHVGWHLSPDTREAVIDDLLGLLHDADRLKALQRHCHDVYQRHFSRRRITALWNAELSDLVSQDQPAGRSGGSDKVARPIDGGPFQPINRD